MTLSLTPVLFTSSIILDSLLKSIDGWNLSSSASLSHLSLITPPQTRSTLQKLVFHKVSPFLPFSQSFIPLLLFPPLKFLMLLYFCILMTLLFYVTIPLLNKWKKLSITLFIFLKINFIFKVFFLIFLKQKFYIFSRNILLLIPPLLSSLLSIMTLALLIFMFNLWLDSWAFIFFAPSLLNFTQFSWLVKLFLPSSPFICSYCFLLVFLLIIFDTFIFPVSSPFYYIGFNFGTTLHLL